MRIPRAPHDWSLTPAEAAALQAELAPRILEVRPDREIRLVAGLDAAFPAPPAGYTQAKPPSGMQTPSSHTQAQPPPGMQTPSSRGPSLCLAAAVLWDLRERRVVEERTALLELTFPYIPGLLSFREAPAVLAALERLDGEPDALLCDGQGRAHPRRFGLACHVGWLADLPAVGCAKSRLAGRYAEPGRPRGSRSPLADRGERIGTVLRTREGVRPLFVSVGHRIDLDTAERLVLDCCLRHRLPEPIRLADRLAALARRRLAEGGGAAP
jgi:deoxyribonuclease V